jgi:hypothetical protein
MKPESQPSAAKALADIPPLRRDIRSPGTWRYFFNYLALGASAIIILIVMIKSGVLGTLWAPFMLIVLALSNLAAMQAAERKSAEPGASPNGGPAEPVGYSGVSSGPPSVS